MSRCHFRKIGMGNSQITVKRLVINPWAPPLVVAAGPDGEIIEIRGIKKVGIAEGFHVVDTGDCMGLFPCFVQRRQQLLPEVL